MQFEHPIEAVIFDMDGLLFDTEVLYFDAMSSVAAANDQELPYALYLSMVGSTREHTNVRLREHFGQGFAAEEFCSQSRSMMLQLAQGRSILKPGVLELLDLLDRLNLPRGIATSSASSVVEQYLSSHGLSHRFNTIVARGDYSHGKPHPAPYLEVASRLFSEPRRCLALEDSFNGVRSASAAGMITVMVPDLLQPSEDLRKLCAFVANDLHQVCRLLAE